MRPARERHPPGRDARRVGSGLQPCASAVTAESAREPREPERLVRLVDGRRQVAQENAAREKCGCRIGPKTEREEMTGIVAVRDRRAAGRHVPPNRAHPNRVPAGYPEMSGSTSDSSYINCPVRCTRACCRRRSGVAGRSPPVQRMRSPVVHASRCGGSVTVLQDEAVIPNGVAHRRRQGRRVHDVALTRRHVPGKRLEEVTPARRWRPSPSRSARDLVQTRSR